MVSFSMNWIFVCGRTLFLFEIMLTSHTGLKNDANLMSKIENTFSCNFVFIHCRGKHVYNKMPVKLMSVVPEDCKASLDMIFPDTLAHQISV